jgi:hypothetical protein
MYSGCPFLGCNTFRQLTKYFVSKVNKLLCCLHSLLNEKLNFSLTSWKITFSVFPSKFTESRLRPAGIEDISVGNCV